MDDPRQFFTDTDNAKIAAKVLDTLAMLAKASDELHTTLLALRTNPKGPFVSQCFQAARASVNAAHSLHLPQAIKLHDAYANGAVNEEEAKHGA